MEVGYVGELGSPTYPFLEGQRPRITTSNTAYDEGALVERAKNGDASAFGELYARYRDAIHRYVAFRVSDARDAEDLTGYVFLRAWESLPRYEPRGYRFTSWLYRIAHNLVADHHRGRAGYVTAPLEVGADVPEEQQPTTLERVIAAEEAATLTRAVARLPAEQREVVLLRFVHGLSHTDIAQRLAKSQGASRVILHRALATLNQMLRSSLVAVLAVLLLVGGVVYAARNARPGEPLYVVRHAIDTVRGALPAPAPPAPPFTDTPIPSATAPAPTRTHTPEPTPSPTPIPMPSAGGVAAAPPTLAPSASPRASTAPAATPAPAAPSPGSLLPSATPRTEARSELSTETAAPANTPAPNIACCAATPTPTATASAPPTITPSPTPSATPAPTLAPTLAPSATPAATPSATATAAATNTSEATSSPTPCCDATEQPTPDNTRLVLAIAVPSRPIIYGGETLTATLVLARRGEIEGNVRVALVLPAELHYVEGSADDGGTYEPATHSVVWRAAQLPARAAVRIGMVLIAEQVRRPTVVRLAARVRVGELVAEREVSLALMPTPTPTP